MQRPNHARRRSPAVQTLGALALAALLGRSPPAPAAPHGKSSGAGPSGSSAENNAEGAALQKQLDALLTTGTVGSGRVTVEVRSLADGRLIYSRNPDQILNPASNTKITTAASALLRLGPEYRYTTDVLADRSYSHGKARLLIVKGRGDPTLTTERLEQIARDLVHRGLVEVGDVVLDDSYFDQEVWGPGWDTETSDKAFAAGVGALSLNQNFVKIYVTPGDKPGAKAKVSLDPEAKGYFDIVSDVTTTKPSKRKGATPHTFPIDDDRTRVDISGQIPIGSEALTMTRRVTAPTFYFGYTFKQILEQHGIKVRGTVRRGTAGSDAKFISSYDSYELGEIVRDMNKTSSNFIAEMLLKTLGAELQGAPGTWPKGVAAMQDALAELGIPKGTYQLKNGSGLNDTNRFSAHQMAGLLATVHGRFGLAAEFIASLPVAARDGTLRLRMDGTEAAGRLRAKTGTLDRAVALSGFLQTAAGEPLVFSFIANDWSGHFPDIIHTADKLGVALASLGQKPAELRAEAAREVALELPPAEENARIASYARLAALHDKKNLGALRSAVRAERDPLVRLAAADALLRTDLESGTGPLLNALPPGHELFDKLRAVTDSLKLPMPVLGSLFDLAAEGNADAFTHLLSMCPRAVAGPPDDPLSKALADGLADVSQANPDETFAALKAAPVEQARAASLLLGAGLAAANLEMDDSKLGQLVLAAGALALPEAVEARLWVRLIERRGLRIATDLPPALPPVSSGG